MLASLQESLEKDYAIGYTRLGPHKMDCEFYIKGKKASAILSRGQSKLLIILVFLINHNLINSYIDSEAVLLVDDLGSELDLENPIRPWRSLALRGVLVSQRETCHPRG